MKNNRLTFMMHAARCTSNHQMETILLPRSRAYSAKRSQGWKPGHMRMPTTRWYCDTVDSVQVAPPRSLREVSRDTKMCSLTANRLNVASGTATCAHISRGRPVLMSIARRCGSVLAARSEGRCRESGHKFTLTKCCFCLYQSLASVTSHDSLTLAQGHLEKTHVSIHLTVTFHTTFLTERANVRRLVGVEGGDDIRGSLQFDHCDQTM